MGSLSLSLIRMETAGVRAIRRIVEGSERQVAVGVQKLSRVAKRFGNLPLHPLRRLGDVLEGDLLKRRWQVEPLPTTPEECTEERLREILGREDLNSFNPYYHACPTDFIRLLIKVSNPIGTEGVSEEKIRKLADKVLDKLGYWDPGWGD